MARETARRKQGSGELALIDRIRRRAARLPRPAELRLGIGDDCAILRPRAGEDIVVTTDFSLEGRHFRRNWHSPEAIGHRLLARGLSDLAAMGARPLAAFLSLALPRTVARQTVWIDRFLDGFCELAEASKTPLAGGDTSESPSDHVLADIMLLGTVSAGTALRRDGARSGDRLFVTGVLGGAAAELGQIAGRKERRDRRTPKPSAGDPNPHPHLFPNPRLAAGAALRRRGLATACLDVSDGLSTDLHHLCEASGVAAVVEAACLPLHPLLTKASPEAALNSALHGGEDYELLFTAPPGVRVPRTLGGTTLTEIGSVEARQSRRPLLTLVHADGRRSPLKAQGWEHLR